MIYAEATGALAALAEATGIPVGETQAGRGALPSDHPSALGAIGATGTPAANRLAREADLVIGIGTRWSDFTTASKSAFQDPGVRFVNVNVAGFDAAKHSGLAVVADARLALEALLGRAGRPPRRCRVVRSRGRGVRRVGPRGRAARHRRPRAAAQPGRGDRRRQRRRRARRRRRVRGRLDARRPAQAVAGARPEGLPRRVRLLVHGLRDPGRHGRQARRARARGVRDDRRRLVPDAPGRAGDRGGRGHQDRRRARAEPRLRVDRRALALDRLGRVRHPLPAVAATSRPTPRASARG